MVKIKLIWVISIKIAKINTQDWIKFLQLGYTGITISWT